MARLRRRRAKNRRCTAKISGVMQKKTGGRSALRWCSCNRPLATPARRVELAVVVGATWSGSGSKKLFSSITCAVFENNQIVDGKWLCSAKSSTETRRIKGTIWRNPTTILAHFPIFDEKKMITGTVQRRSASLRSGHIYTLKGDFRP